MDAMHVRGFWFLISGLLLTFYCLLLAPSRTLGATCAAVPDGLTQDELRSRLSTCEAEIQDQAVKIQAKQRESTSLERDISILSYRIDRAQNEIKLRDLTIKKLGSEISTRATELLRLSAQVKRMQTATAELLRSTNELDSRSVVEILLTEKRLADAYSDEKSFAYIEDALDKSFNKLRDIQTAIKAQKAKLEVSKTEENKQKGLKEIEKRQTASQQNQKHVLLSMTKIEAAAYQRELEKKQAIAAQIKNKMLQLTSGGELRFEDALNIARVAERATGVRSALILSVLTQETGLDGVIGRNLGHCVYDTPWSNAAGTVMSNSQKPTYLDIMREIGMDPETTPVSCPISRDGQYGGAMGPAQFMPKTWWDSDTETGFKIRVGRATGHNPPSPFTNIDAFTATALYLSDGLQTCQSIYTNLYDQERCVGAKYYAGGNWRKHLKGYGASVASRAAAFQKDIDFLESQL